MSVIHAPPKQEIDPKLLGTIGGAFVALSGVFLRLWYLQVVQTEEFLARAAASGVSRLDIMAPRGLIFDRKKRLLAGVRSEFVVTGIPAVVNKNKWVMDEVVALTGADKKKLEKKLKDGFRRPNMPAPLFVGVNVDVATNIAESWGALPGIDVSYQPMRYYPDTIDMAHILGYVGLPSERDMDRLGDSVTPSTYVGKDGIERAHDTELMGTRGSESVVSSKKKAVRTISRVEAIPGKQLILSIDLDIQKQANALLEQSCRAHKSDGGAVVMIEPSSGEIICMASRPTYDSAIFDGGVSVEDYAALSEDPRHPLFNRAASGAYAPGSTYKIATAIAAAKAGIFDTARSKYCPGYYQIGGQKFRCENHGGGTLAFMTAFSKSCNSYFGSWAEVIGKDSMRQTLLDLGFGQKTGVDLQGEVSGVVPTDKWLKGRPFFLGHVVQMGFGQGYITATPLQMANLVALVANNGTQYQPHFVKAEVGTDGKVVPTEPILARNFELPADFWSSLKQAMVSVTQSGTAHRLGGISGVTWGGKTGSAEHSGRGPTHAWFVGIAPMENPKVVIAVMVEKSGHGGDVAVPIAQRLVSAYLRDAAAASSLPRTESANAASPTSR
ncbi:MAG: penicillin-binding protein 2 [Fimbriimonadaceae bacterium]